MLRFIHLTPFDRKWNDLGLDDEDLRALQVLIADEPDRAPFVRGTGASGRFDLDGEAPRGKS